MALEWLLGEDFFKSPVYFYFVIIFFLSEGEELGRRNCVGLLTIIKSPPKC